MLQRIDFFGGWAQNSALDADLLQALADWAPVRYRPARQFIHESTPTNTPLFTSGHAVVTPDKSGEPALLRIGCSLGGLYALLVAAREENAGTAAPAALVLLNSSPRFVKGQGWLGISPVLMADMTTMLAESPGAVLARFDLLSVQGAANPRACLRRRRKIREASSVFDQNTAARDREITSLCLGLEHLQTWDLRPVLRALRQPVLMIYGQQDAVLPVEQATSLCAWWTSGRMVDDDARPIETDRSDTGGSDNLSLLCMPGLGHLPEQQGARPVLDCIQEWWRGSVAA